MVQNCLQWKNEPKWFLSLVWSLERIGKSILRYHNSLGIQTKQPWKKYMNVGHKVMGFEQAQIYQIWSFFVVQEIAKVG